MTLQADPAESLLSTPVETPERRRRAPILVSALVHLLVLALVLYEQSRLALQTAQELEVPVEVIVEPPPQPPPPEPEPQPEPEPEKEQPKPKEKPPQQKIILDEKPAYDAPRAANRETIRREAPDQETKAERQAPPDHARAARPSPETTADPQQQKEARAELAPELPEPAEEDKPDAEIVEQAKPAPETQPDEKRGEVEIKASPEPKLKSISEQIASLEPVPDFKFAGSSKPAPVSGGTADASYLSILYGMIVPHMHVPPRLRGKRPPNLGLIQFYVDGAGHLTHQAVARSSGFPELDAAALAAVRRGAPFPAPPGGHAMGIVFHFAGH